MSENHVKQVIEVIDKEYISISKNNLEISIKSPRH